MILKKIGRRKSIMLTNLVCIIAVIPTVFENIYMIIIGKFFFGLSAGGLIVSSSIYLNETVPAEHSSAFGFTTNFGVITGIMTCLLMGIGLPDPETDVQAAKDDTNWIIITLTPAIISFCGLLNWIFVFKLECVKACLSAEQGSALFDEGKTHVNKIYPSVDRDQIFQELLDAHLEGNKD